MSLLFSESPVLAVGILAATALGYYLKSNLVVGVGIVLFIFMLYFYRYTPLDLGDLPDNTIVSPCEGTVLDVLNRYDYYYIPIFLSPMNKHTQIYPANCQVLSRKYDYTGEFKPVMNLSKSQNNEKKIHTLALRNGAVMQLTQLSGFLPRMITSSDALNSYKAGDYLGMIKFGSRVDLLMPKLAPDGSRLKLSIAPNDSVCIGDFVGSYQ